jgi:hypothetical protein
MPQRSCSKSRRKANHESRKNAVENGTFSLRVPGTGTHRMLLYPVLNYNGWVGRILHKEAEKC